MVKCHGKVIKDWPSPINCLSSLQLLDLPNPGIDYLVLVQMMLCEYVNQFLKLY